MLSFDAVARHQPNKYVPSAKPDEAIDFGFFECNYDNDGQDRDEALDTVVGSWKKTYYRYAGAARETCEIALSKEGRPLLESGENREISDTSGSDWDSSSIPGSHETFVPADTRHAKYAKCIEIVKKAHPSTRILVVVDETTTDAILMISLLCLSDVAAVPAGQSVTSVQVATQAQLKQVRGPVSIIINVDMMSSLADLAARAELLESNGTMRTLFMSKLEEKKLREFVSQLFKCGLVIPLELEEFFI